MNLKNLQFLFKPSYWIMLGEYSKSIDVLVNKLLDNYEIEAYDGYTVRLGATDIWVANRPHGCGFIYEKRIVPLNLSRPSRLTIKRLLKRVDEHILNEALKNNSMERHTFL